MKDVRKSSDKDLAVVIKPYFIENFILSNTRNIMRMRGTQGKIRLEIFNLSSEHKTGNVILAGLRTSELPSSITLAPMSKTVLVMSCTAAPAVKEPWQFYVTGKFNGKQISPVLVPLQPVTDLNNAESVAIDVTKPERWNKNTSGNMTVSSDESENAVRFDVEFPPMTDHWIYPEFPLELPAESLKNAVGIEFEIKASALGKDPELRFALLMLVQEKIKEHGKSETVSFDKPSLQWEKIMIPLDGLETQEKIQMLRIGMNPHADKLSYWIRNLKFLYKSKQ